MVFGVGVQCLTSSRLRQWRDFPLTQRAGLTCSCVQALARIRRSSLRQVEMTLDMALGLVVYFLCGATSNNNTQRHNCHITEQKVRKAL